MANTPEFVMREDDMHFAGDPWAYKANVALYEAALSMGRRLLRKRRGTK